MDLWLDNKMGKEDEEVPKYQLEDILNKKKPPPQILDLHGIKWVNNLYSSLFATILFFRIDTEEEFEKTLEKIPDYRIKPEKVI